MSIERENIGIFGKMNSGKSTVMNLITQQETSLVDETPGTTADTKITLMELHGLGPVRLYDTAGFDESGGLGEKKKKKVFNDLKEVDLVLLVMDPSTEDLDTEETILEKARELDKQILIIYNQREGEKYHDQNVLLPLLKFHRSIRLDINDERSRMELIRFILENYRPRSEPPPLIPFLKQNTFYALIIPMDEETPAGRFLRPQQMVIEYLTRNGAWPVAFRLNLTKARSNFEKDRIDELDRYDRFLKSFEDGPEYVITDSQAVDVVHQWTPEGIGLTTFSITMINYMSGGKLDSFVEGLDALERIDDNSRVLIVEACNHTRICDDIGTSQIPDKLHRLSPGLRLDYNFGREFRDPEKLAGYDLVIHCGGCMISQQKMEARVRDMEIIGVPFTNYGLFLSRFQGVETLKRVLDPWGVNFQG